MVSSGKHLTLGIIPARWGSSRFPGKPLHLIAGKPLVQHVWERAQLCTMLNEIVIATDDERILQAAADFGAKVGRRPTKNARSAFEARYERECAAR